MIMGYASIGESMGNSSVSTVENITKVTISNAIYDDLYGQHITNSNREQILPYKNWKETTYFHAKFEGNTYCGNADFSVENTKDILVKRRKKGEFQWFTLYDIAANGADDYTFTVYDPYAPKGKLDYAVVPVINGFESEYSIATIDYSFDGVMIVEKDKSIWTVTDISISENKNIQAGVYNTIQGSYPYVFYNGENNYFTGTLSSTYLKIDPTKTPCVVSDVDSMQEYYAEVMEFLSDKKTKILKYCDGRIRMVEITDPPSDEHADNWNLHTISFGYTEMGNVYSNKDMNRYGFLDVGEEWWVK